MLPRAVKSLLVQTWQDFEVVIIDDNLPGSKISGVPALLSFLQDSRIRIIENPSPVNASAARNVGLRIARGEWITYLDDDDAYHPEKLQKQLAKANDTGLPVGLCGLAYNLNGRRRERQIDKDFFGEAELLLDAIADTKAIFHRRTPSVFFRESLFAAEDAYFFHQLLQTWNVHCAFNVPETLIEVFPQIGQRVNTNAQALWESSYSIYTDFAKRYGDRPAKIFLIRAKIQRLKFERGSICTMMRLSMILLLLRGHHEVRFILNALLYKIPSLRDRLVS